MSDVKDVSIWDIFDEITCINVRDRTDRLSKAKTRFMQIGLGNKVKYWIVERSPYGGKYGCCESHYDIIKRYNENNVKYGIIFEDDVIFNTGWQNVVKDAAQFIASKPATDWDVLYLGSNMQYPVQVSKINPKIWNAKLSLTHAYIISKVGMKKFLNNIHLEEFEAPDCLPHDDLLPNIFNQMYGHVNNNIIYQEWLDTDNQWEDFEFFPKQQRDLKQWCMCKFASVWIPQINYFVKLTMNIPFHWRPYIQLPIKMDAVIKQENQSTKRYTLQNPFGSLFNSMVSIWTFFILFYSSPTKALRVIKYYTLFRFNNYYIDKINNIHIILLIILCLCFVFVSVVS